MFTILRLLHDGVAGAGWCALILLTCGLLRLAAGRLLRGGWRAALRSLPVPTLLCGLCWHVVFYPVDAAYRTAAWPPFKFFCSDPFFCCSPSYFRSTPPAAHKKAPAAQRAAGAFLILL